MACHKNNIILGFRENEFTDDFFINILNKIDSSATLLNWKSISINGDGEEQGHYVKYESDFGKDVVLGLRGFRMTYSVCDGDENEAHAAKKEDNCVTIPGGHNESSHIIQNGLSNSETEHNNLRVVKDIVIKFKPTGLQRSLSCQDVVVKRSAKLAQLWPPKIREAGDIQGEYKDMAAVSTNDPIWKRIQPKVFYSFLDDERKIYYYAMESYIEGGFENLDKSDDHEVTCWTEEHIFEVFDNIAQFHATYYDRTGQLEPLLTRALSVDGVWRKEKFMKFKELIDEMLACNLQTYEHILDKESSRLLCNVVKNLEYVCDIIDNSPQTIIHNDFSVRNICLRPNPAKGYSRVCIYDWERMMIFPPQHDIVELLVFALPTNESPDVTVWDKYISAYHAYFSSAIRLRHGENSENVLQSLDKEYFQKVFDACLMEYAIWHLSLYGIQGYTTDSPFLPRVLKAATNYLKIIAPKYDFLNA